MERAVRFENFVTYNAFITTLTSELNGSVLVTGVTALGQYYLIELHPHCDQHYRSVE